MNSGKVNKNKEEGLLDPNQSQAKQWAFLRRTPNFFNWFESPQIIKRIKPYIKTGQVVADIGCGWGYYTFILADLVGPKGRVIPVDISEKCIISIQKKAAKKGHHNIDAHASTAADLSFIKSKSVDFVFANGLLCSMENGRPLAVKEIKRILKPQGYAYISLGAKPPLGLVDEPEWKNILKGFSVVKGGVFEELWVLVT